MQDVERFMKHYFLVAKDVGDLTAVILGAAQTLHVSDLLDLLNRHNFVQCQNSYITPDGILRLLHSDLSNPEVVKWHVTERPFFNSTSLTGTAHARNFYIAVNHPWRPPHDGCPPDIYQWRRLMRHPDFSGATSSRVTALQLPTSMGREDSDQAERLAELEQWADLVRQPDAQARIDALVIQAAFDQLREASLSSERLRRSLRREKKTPGLSKLSTSPFRRKARSSATGREFQVLSAERMRNSSPSGFASLSTWTFFFSTPRRR